MQLIRIYQQLCLLIKGSEKNYKKVSKNRVSYEIVMILYGAFFTLNLGEIRSNKERGEWQGNHIRNVLQTIIIYRILWYNLKQKLSCNCIIFFGNILKLKGMNQMVEVELVAIKVSPLLISIGIIIIIGVGLLIYMKKRNKS